MQVQRKDDGSTQAYEPEQEGPLSLATLTDYQKKTLADISYIDLTLAGKIRLYEGGGIPFSELEQYLIYPSGSSSGNPIPGIQYESVSESIMGDILDSDKTLCQNVVEAGLGDLILTDITMDPNTGFCGFTFKDQAGNTGISYRGSDFDYENGAISDWVKANLGGHLLGDSEQGYQASLYFLKHCDRGGNNYTYGYSLGGNLVQQCFRNNHELIQEAVSINGNPISPKSINTPEIEAAFNSDKFNCCIIAGDLVALTKKTDKYKSNIRIIENVDGISTSFMAAHGLKQASYDENGNFKTMDYDTAIAQMKAEYEKAGDVAFGKNGWELLGIIQSADSWLTDKTQKPPDELKESVIKQMILDEKIPISFSDKGEPTSFFGVISDAWDWLSDTCSLAIKPVSNIINGTLNLAGSTALEYFVCKEEISDNLELWWEDITDLDMGEWVADMAAQFGLKPQRLDGSKIDNAQDLEEWRKEVIEHMGSKAPKWIQDDSINIKIATAILNEEKHRAEKGESKFTVSQITREPTVVLDELFGENNQYTESMERAVSITELCEQDPGKLFEIMRSDTPPEIQSDKTQVAQSAITGAIKGLGAELAKAIVEEAEVSFEPIERGRE